MFAALYIIQKSIGGIIYLKEFHRESSGITVQRHKLPVPMLTRYIRFHPTHQRNWNCLRVEVYGTTGALTRHGNNNNNQQPLLDRNKLLEQFL